ncbi:MAG: GxxExxY protein [bacterium]|nr:GxxExxY protein [bacterium]
MPSSGQPELVYPELSFKLVGILFEVYNDLGPGHKEKYYENAVAVALGKAGIKYQRQLHSPLMFGGQKVGSYFFDFLIEGSIVLELKQGERFSKKNMEQVLTYLRVHNLKLGIIAQFAQHDLKFKRIVNIR